ncbi:arg8p [Saccharomyces arboricola H-6]|uniref:Acetylornithine aminotransferase, mitochondrial n=1 Tax=Saccharomyces arboricola (strain H-6 / AS 2.3317 / CBS 10644) TaxID=1160507 RepID=J8LID2_SACAR|nr:arg8p [Saccharomyces arboricola H-6]
MFKRYLSSTSSKRFTSILEEKAFQVTTYSRPEDVCVTRGKNAKLYDDLNGKEYIDFTAGIAVTALGHANPKVAEILYHQAKKLVHSSNLYFTKECLDLSEKIVEKTKQFGGQYDASKVFLCNSGTEANEAALKFAKKYGIMKHPNKEGIVAFENSFHGRTMGALSVTWNSKYRTPFGHLVPNVSFLNLQDDLTKLQDYISAKKDDIAGLIIEPIQGEGGVFPVEIEKLTALKKICQDNDVIVIHDEIQCGLGRSGKLWAHAYLPKEAHPDIFTSAKALGNGFPIAATIVNDKVNNALKVGDHGTTYGGNPLACAVSNYVLDTIADEAFLKNVSKKSEILKKGLREIQAKYPKQIKTIRGKGLMLGAEFVEPPTEVIKKARQLGLLIITAGKSTVRFVPALTIEDELIEEGMNVFENAVKAVYA